MVADRIEQDVSCLGYTSAYDKPFGVDDDRNGRHGLAQMLTVDKKGGLSTGKHDIELSYTYSCSYFPPFLDTVLGSKVHKRSLVLV